MVNKAAVNAPIARFDARDAYTLINAVVEQQQGQGAMMAVDTASFVSVFNQSVDFGTESLFEAMTTVVGRTIFSSRPYRAKLAVMRVLEARWGDIIRKVVYLSTKAEATTSYNTADAQPLQNGKSVDMYVINNPGVVQLAMNRTLSLQTHITRFQHQLNVAMRTEAEYLQFWDGFMVEFQNCIEAMNEARRRLVLLNAVAGSNYLGQVIDLVEGYNTKYGTHYTREQLLSANFKRFMMYTAAEIKKVSKSMTDRSEAYQQKIKALEDAGKSILHHAPVARQRLVMFAPLLIDQETTVLPELFGPGYLDIMRHEEVNFWQNPDDPSAISVTPAVLSPEGTQMSAPQQDIPYVAAYLYDEEHLGVFERFQQASVTRINSAGLYWNIYMHWLFSAWNDFTEKHMLFVLGPGGAGEDGVQNTRIVNDTETPLPLAAQNAIPINAGGSLNVDANITNNPLPVQDIPRR